MKTQPIPVNTQSTSIKRFLSISSDLGKLATSLQYSEYELILFMGSQGVWKGPDGTSAPIPPAPDGFIPGAGSIDCGIYLYLLNTPSALQAFGNTDLDLVRPGFIVLLDLYKIELPPSLMTVTNYQELTSTSLVYTDGSIISIAPLAFNDPNWLYMFINLGKTVFHDSKYNDGVLPSLEKLTPVVLSGSNAGSVTIGLLSDWGAGSPDAIRVIDGLTSLIPAPDYLIHLGDIYYSGSPSAGSPFDFNYSHPGEVSDNFLNFWPAAYSEKSFTLNGNHEMYCGANGYFGNALAAPAFKSQQGLSYGALQIGDWTILYLDSAFYSNILHLYNYGSIGGATGIQGSWISSLGLNPQKVIVMTHHTGFDPTCSAIPQKEYYQPFWDEIHGALGGDPYAWYWGHIHNAIVYATPVTIVNSNAEKFTTNTKCRCIGNGIVPYGYSAAFDIPSTETNPFEWCAQYSYTDSGEIPNGFTTLTFDIDTQNQVTQITENYYLINAPAEPVFTNALFSTTIQP